jgi:hypothetical protein
MMSNKRCREILAKHELPEPPAGELTDVRWMAYGNEWYIEMVGGWVYWLDPRDRTWKRTIGIHP